MPVLWGAARARNAVRAMRRLVLALLLLVPVAPSAVAAPRGDIVGRVLDGNSGDPVAGVDITLTIGSTEDADVREVTATTDRRGRYSFESLRTGSERFYALDARYEGGLFAGRPVTLPSDTAEPPEIETTLRVWPTTTDPATILMRRNDLFVVQDRDGAAIIESVTIVNPGNRAYIGRGGETDSPSLGFALPAEAEKSTLQILDADVDVPRLLDTDFGFGITTAIPPGQTSLTFTYRVAGTGGNIDLSRRALYDIAEMSVYAAPPLEIDSNRLQPTDEELELEERTYKKWTAEGDIDPADMVQLSAVAQGEDSPWLIVGGAGALVLALLVSVVAYRRARRQPARPMEPHDREDVVRAIARLDLLRESGEIDDARWERERDDLKRRLEDLTPARR